MCVLSCFDVDPIEGLSGLVRSHKVNFDTVDGVGWYPYNLDDRVDALVPTYEGVNRGVLLPKRSCVSATVTSMQLKECNQALQDLRCVVSRPEVPIYTRSKVQPISTHLLSGSGQSRGSFAQCWWSDTPRARGNRRAGRGCRGR